MPITLVYADTVLKGARPAANGRKAACLTVTAMLVACSDGATRIAFDIESGVAAFERSTATSYSIRHVPDAKPDGCAGSYTVQFSAHSSLLIWCKDSASSQVTSSHTTTYHLRFVEVPQTFKLDKAA